MSEMRSAQLIWTNTDKAPIDCLSSDACDVSC